MKHIAKFIIVLSLCLLSQLSIADIRIASWNIERLGHGGHKSFPALAKIASRFDLIAVQEVMTAQGIYRLQAYLEDYTGEVWGVRYSDTLGRSTYREKYAFLWRESKINFLGRELTYLDITDGVRARAVFRKI